MLGLRGGEGKMDQIKLPYPIRDECKDDLKKKKKKCYDCGSGSGVGATMIESSGLVRGTKACDLCK